MVPFQVEARALPQRPQPLLRNDTNDIPGKPWCVPRFASERNVLSISPKSGEPHFLSPLKSKKKNVQGFGARRLGAFSGSPARRAEFKINCEF